MSVADISHTVPAVGFGQANFAQCWLASYRMAFAFLKRTDTILADLKTAGIDVDTAKDKGLSDTDFKKAAEALKLTPLLSAPFHDTSIWPGLDPGAEKFLDQLKDGPLWVARRVDGGGLHAVLVWGYTSSGDKLRYNNPFPGPDDAVPKWMDTNGFVKDIAGATGSVTKLPAKAP